MEQLKKRYQYLKINFIAYLMECTDEEVEKLNALFIDKMKQSDKGHLVWSPKQLEEQVDENREALLLGEILRLRGVHPCKYKGLPIEKLRDLEMHS